MSHRTRPLTQKELARRVRKALTSRQKSRAKTVFAVFNVPFPKVASPVVEDLLPLFDAAHLSTAQKSALGWLLLQGTYPHLRDVLPVENALGIGQPLRAMVICNEGARGGPENLVVFDGDIADVTRYSAQRRVSGIPRVVRNLVFSDSFHDVALGVWERGILGIGSRGPYGSVRFDPAHWRRAQQFKARIMAMYLFLFRRIGLSPLGLVVMRLIAQTLLPLAYRLVRAQRHPRLGVLLLEGQTYFLPEVSDKEVSSRLLAWRRAFPGVGLDVVLHDLLPVQRPEFFTLESVREHQTYLELVGVSDRIFVGTKVLANDLKSHLGLSGQDFSKVRVLPLPASGDRTPNPRPVEITDETPYFLFFGGFEERKGLADLVDYLESRPPKSIHFRVLVLGAPQPEQGGAPWDLAERISRLRQPFEIVGWVGQEEIGGLIESSAGVLYLSHAEGYGFPIVDAVAKGKIVLTQPSATNAELASLYGGTWHQFDFSSNKAFDVMNRIAHSGVDWASLGVEPPKAEAIPTSVDDWASSVRSRTREVSSGQRQTAV